MLSCRLFQILFGDAVFGHMILKRITNHIGNDGGRGRHIPYGVVISSFATIQADIADTMAAIGAPIEGYSPILDRASARRCNQR